MRTGTHEQAEYFQTTVPYFSGAAASSIMLSGCDAFDFVGDNESATRHVLEKANDLTYLIQRQLQGHNALAREYGESELRQGQNRMVKPIQQQKNMKHFALPISQTMFCR